MRTGGISMLKKLNIAVVGCGFMGRTHSNAFRKVTNFFDTPYQPVLKRSARAMAKKRKRLRIAGVMKQRTQIGAS